MDSQKTSNYVHYIDSNEVLMRSRETELFSFRSYHIRNTLGVATFILTQELVSNQAEHEWNASPFHNLKTP